MLNFHLKIIGIFIPKKIFYFQYCEGKHIKKKIY